MTRFRPGDEVFAETIRGVQWRNGGAFAEYATAPEEGVALKPPTIGFEEAAAVPTAGLIALNNLPQRRVPPGHRVLVNGAAGGVGAIALQLAKAYGAHVTGVDHPRKLALVTSLGADEVIDYTSKDYTQGARQWDLIFDVPGNHSFDETAQGPGAGRRVHPDRARRVRGHRPPLARQHPPPARADGALGRGPRAARWLVQVPGQARADDHPGPSSWRPASSASSSTGLSRSRRPPQR